MSSLSSSIPLQQEQHHQFIPPSASVSLSSDAPGYFHKNGNKSNDNGNDKNDSGPACWKCKGNGFVPKYKNVKPKDDTECKKCSICDGKGYLPRKKREMECASMFGQITRKRKAPKGWKNFGPTPAALESSEYSSKNEVDKILFERAIELVRQAEDPEVIKNLKRNEEVEVSEHGLCNKVEWLPRKGEQLCNLVGNWRILQHSSSTSNYISAGFNINTISFLHWFAGVEYFYKC